MTLLSIWFGWTTTTSPWLTTGMRWGYLRNHPQMAELKWTIPHTLVVWLPFFTFPYIVHEKIPTEMFLLGVFHHQAVAVFVWWESHPPQWTLLRPEVQSARDVTASGIHARHHEVCLVPSVTSTDWGSQGRFAGGVYRFDRFSSLCALKKPTCLALGHFETGGTWGTAMVSAPQFSARHVKSKSPAGPSCAKEIWDDLSGWVVGIHESTTTWFSSNTNLVLLCLGLSEFAQNHRRRPYTDTLFVIPPVSKSSQSIGDAPNLGMAWNWTHSFVRYSYRGCRKCI